MALSLAPLPESVPVPITLLPSLKVTVPDGSAAPPAPLVTAAVKVTSWPMRTGLAEELMAVLDEAVLTV